MQTLSISPPPGAPPVRPHTASDFRSRRYSAQKHSRSLPTTPDPIRELNHTERIEISGQGNNDTSQTTNNDGKLLLTVKTNPIRTRRIYKAPRLLNSSDTQLES